MIPLPSNVRVWIATGHTDMRRSFNRLVLQVQEALKRDPHDGQIFVFRGRRGDLVKVLWHDGQGLCPFAKRLRARSLPVAIGDGWRLDHAGAARLSARGDRLAGAAEDVASARGRLSQPPVHSCVHGSRAIAIRDSLAM